MEPKVPTGSLVVTRPVNQKNVRIGDIIVFKSPNKPTEVILHRVVKIISADPYRFKTKGDANKSVDNWDVMGEGILGQYIIAIPFVGKLVAFIKTKIGFGLLILFPAAIIIFGEIIKIKKNFYDEVERRVNERVGKMTVILFLLGITTIAKYNVAWAKYSDKVGIKGIRISTSENFDDEKNCSVKHYKNEHKIKIKCRKIKDHKHKFECGSKRGEFEDETEIESRGEKLDSRIMIDQEMYFIEE